MYDCLTDLGEWNAVFESAMESTGDDLFVGFPVAREWGPWDHSVTSLVHRILSIQQPVDFTDEASIFYEACRLASWFYLAEIRHRFYIRAVDTSVQQNKFQGLMERHASGRWEGLENLQFWVLMVAFLQVPEGPRRAWFAQEVRRVARELGISSCAQAEVQLKRLLWMDNVHGHRLRQLQEEIWV